MSDWLSFAKKSLFYSLSMFWIWIIGQQWIFFMDFTWFEETKSIVWLTITFVAVAEMLLPIKRIYRVVLEAVVILYIIHRELVRYWVYTPSGSLADRIRQYIEHASPYVWIALGAWLLMVLSASLVGTKRRILLFSGMNVIAFCILDSFTPVNLWQEVAWTVFASLGWLVSEHFRLVPGPFSGRMAAPAEVPGQNPDPCGRFVFRHVHRRRQHAERSSDVDRPVYRLDRYFGRSGGRVRCQRRARFRQREQFLGLQPKRQPFGRRI